MPHQPLADYLRFYSPYLPNIGLYHGQIGVLLVLQLYAFQNKDDLLQESVDQLLEDFMQKVYENLPIGVELGLSGIGIAFSLLYYAGAISVNLNDLLSDIDARIMAFDPRRISDTSFRSGLAGVAAYVSLRARCNSLTSFDTRYLQELEQRCNELYCLPSQNAFHILIQDLDAPLYDITSFERHPIVLNGGSSYHLLQSYDTLFHIQ